MRRARAREIGRAFAIVVLLLAAALARPLGARGAPAREPARLPARLDVRADAIGFYPYSDATLLAAEGHAILRAGRRTVTADSIRIDLQANKLVASGNVVVSGVNETLHVTAYALELATGKADAIRFDPVPTTIAFRDDDLSTAREGPAPPNTFGVADLTGQRPYIRSRHASVTVNSNIRMTPAEFPTATSASGVLPTFVYTFEYNQLFGAAQALPSTTIDYPYTLFGTPNSLTAFHARYGQYDGIELGIDEHLVDGNREYLVASLLPFRGRRFDLAAFQTIRRGLTQNFTGTIASGYVSGTYYTQETAREFSVRAQTTATNGYNDEELTAGTIDHTIPHLINYQLIGGYGYEHNPGQSPFAGDFHYDFSGTAQLPTLHLPRQVSAQAQYQYLLTKYDIPRLVTKSIETFSLSRSTIRLSRAGSRNLTLFGSISIEDDELRFRDDARGFLYLPDPGQPYYAPDGTLDPGYFSYIGLSTLRTYQLISTYQGPNDFSFQLALTHARDFPQGNGIGRPPLFASATLQFRATKALRVQLNRGYSFAVTGQRFTQYGFSVSP